ncbi:hypothetical protein RND81_04G069900 [Saponaria officinalis]|uniref:THO1-MOS11 C-terminal domain-containing protein n=1 Tax=Saponaria officinalis TaxID=3572 RepID=A0AAW1LD75_SAPOF
MATKTQKPSPKNPKIENPDKTLTLKSPNMVDLNHESPLSGDTPHSPADKRNEDSIVGKGASMPLVSPTGGVPNDIDKKMKRAERFGVPVLMSEEEKRNSRAERFGTVTGPKVSKSEEELKRKARAERFGIPVPSADQEEKKKARIERFGSVMKTDDVNNAEEEKKKARALRFSHPQGTAVLHTKGDKDSVAKTAIVDNASGGA